MIGLSSKAAVAQCAVVPMSFTPRAYAWCSGPAPVKLGTPGRLTTMLRAQRLGLLPHPTRENRYHEPVSSCPSPR
jgi:hypothetical protein